MIAEKQSDSNKLNYFLLTISQCAEGDDYTIDGDTVTFAEGTSAGSSDCFFITVHNDSLSEGNEVFVLQLKVNLEVTDELFVTIIDGMGQYSTIVV